jgi:hypothetical protein
MPKRVATECHGPVLYILEKRLLLSAGSDCIRENDFEGVDVNPKALQ